MKRALIFASGNGSNFQAIVEYFKNKNIPVTFELLVDKKECYAIERAKNLDIAYHFVPFGETETFLKSKEPYHLFILAGYMRILPARVLNLGTFVNIHPSLLPKFKGLNAIEQAYMAKETHCGVSVHYVCEEVDSGEIIKQKSTEIKKDMTLEELETKIHKIEHEIYPPVIEKILFGE